MSSVLNSRDENKIELVICIIIAGIFVTNFSAGLFSITGISSSTISNVCKAVIFVALVFCLPSILRRTNAKMLFLIGSIILIASIQYLFFPELDQFFNNTLVTFVTTILPVVLCFLAVRDYESLISKIIVLSYIISAVTALSYFIFQAKLFSEHYSMGFSNTMIFPTDVLLLNAFLREKRTLLKVLSYFLAFVNSVCICLYGSRGALIAIFAFLVFILIKNRPKNIRTLIIKLLLIVLIFLFLFNLNQILASINNYYTLKGFSSRTLRVLLRNNDDSGRLIYWRMIIEKLDGVSLLPKGINVEYSYIGIYAHSFVLELYSNLGLILGGMVILIILICVLLTLFAPWTNYTELLTLMMFGFIPLTFWSGTIWGNMFFWIWIIMFKPSECLQRFKNRFGINNDVIKNPLNQ